MSHSAPQKAFRSLAGAPGNTITSAAQTWEDRDVCVEDSCSVDIAMGDTPRGTEGQPRLRAAVLDLIANLGEVSVSCMFYGAAEQRFPPCKEDLW